MHLFETFNAKGLPWYAQIKRTLEVTKRRKISLALSYLNNFCFYFFKPMLLLHKALCNIVIPVQMQLKSMFEAFLKGSRLQTHVTSSPEDLPVLGISQVIF